jgi:hypothetical protein
VLTVLAMLTLTLLTLAVLMFFISEIFGDVYPLIQDRFRIAGSFVIILLVVWIVGSVSAGTPFLPDFNWYKIVIEKCQTPC